MSEANLLRNPITLYFKRGFGSDIYHTTVPPLALHYNLEFGIDPLEREVIILGWPTGERNFIKNLFMEQCDLSDSNEKFAHPFLPESKYEGSQPGA